MSGPPIANPLRELEAGLWPQSPGEVRDPFRPDVAEESVEEMREKVAQVDPDTAEYIDEVVARAMQEKKHSGLKEGELTPGEMFRSLTPEQKAAVFATYQVATPRGVGHDHPFWIDWDAVPKNLFVYWFSPRIVTALGMRGFRLVANTPEARRWVPNARQLGSSKWIEHANYRLVAIDADEKLARDVANHRKTNALLTNSDERFKSALRSAAGMLGLPRDRAEQLDRLGLGLIAIRGLDPDAARQYRETGRARPDRVLGEGEED